MLLRIELGRAPAAHPAVRAHLHQHVLVASGRRLRARARRHVRPPRRHAGDPAELRRIVGDVLDGHQPVLGVAQHRDGAEQAARVRVQRLVEELEHVGVLHHAPGVHHADHVGVLRHHAQVVGDEHDAHVPRALELAQELQDLRLDGHVERGGRLVRQQHLRPARKRHRDHHALAHAAGELVRVHVEPLFRLLDAHVLHRLHGDPARLLRAHLLVQEDGLHQLVADGVDGVEARHRLLEDHGDLPAADGEHVVLGERADVAALEVDAATVEAARRPRDELHGAHRGHALAAAGLAHHRQRLLREERHVHAVHRLDARAAVGVVEADGEVGDLEDGAREAVRIAHRAHRVDGGGIVRCLHGGWAHQCAAFRSFGSMASRIASPSRL